MSASNTMITSSKGTSTLVRPKFGPGMLLQHDDLELLSAYTREITRLMFGSLFGCGVVCGLVVRVDAKCGKVGLTVGAGLALGCSGVPVYLPKDHRVVVDEHCDPKLSTPLWVVLCGTVKCCAPRPAICGSDDDEAPAACTRERDGFEIRVVSAEPECACGCLEPAKGQGIGYHESARGSAANWSDTSTTGGVDAPNDRCKCVDPLRPCYQDHYAGKCGCQCGDGCSDCECECILLARLDNDGDHEQPAWSVDHSVRRFIRPVLMRDPQVELEQAMQLLARDAARVEAEAQAPAAALAEEPESKAKTKSARASKSAGS